MAIYVTGDIHGDAIERFSYKRHPQLRELAEDDIFIICGDFGLPWATNSPLYPKIAKRELYHLHFLNSKPWTTIVIGGNHEDYDFYETLPIVEKYGSQVRQMVLDGEIFNNIYIIIDPCILDINGYKCLCIPGADSHDIWHTPLDPEAPDFKETYKDYKKRKLWFRVKGWTWFPQEKIKIDAAQALVNDIADSHIDFIFTHECPVLFYQTVFSGRREKPNEGQYFLERVRENVDFGHWYHGHRHEDRQYPAPYIYYDNYGKEYQMPGDDRITVIYYNIEKIAD